MLMQAGRCFTFEPGSIGLSVLKGAEVRVRGIAGGVGINLYRSSESRRVSVCFRQLWLVVDRHLLAVCPQSTVLFFQYGAVARWLPLE